LAELQKMARTAEFTVDQLGARLDGRIDALARGSTTASSARQNRIVGLANRIVGLDNRIVGLDKPHRRT